MSLCGDVSTVVHYLTLICVFLFVSGVLQGSWVNTVNIRTPASLGTA